MDVNTGRLITGARMRIIVDEFYDAESRAAFVANFTPVPDDLQKAAQIKLSGKDEAMVSLASGGKLSTWAAQERNKKQAQEKQRRKMVKASRRRNRG